MSSSKKEPIILTKENSNNQIIEITAYHLQDLSAVEKAPNLCKLNLIGGELKNFQSLEKCSKLQALNLRLTKVEDFSSLQKIKSIRYLEVVGMQKELIETISKMSELKSLTLKHCCLSSLRGLIHDEDHFTDDSVLTFALAEWTIEYGKVSLGNGEHKYLLAKKFYEFTEKYPDKAYGLMYIDWICKYEDTEKIPMPNNSYGNGAAMRVSPVAYVFDEIEMVEKYARLQAEIRFGFRMQNVG